MIFRSHKTPTTMSTPQNEHLYNICKSYKLESSFESLNRFNKCGIVNTGCKCYMNCILQCLFNVFRLTDYILSGKLTDHSTGIDSRCSNEFKLVSYYSTILKKVFTKNTLVSNRKISAAMGILYPTSGYDGDTQEDALEFFQRFVDVFHRALKIPVAMTPKPAGHMNSTESDWIKFYIDTYANDYSEMVNTFYGHLVTRVTCTTCRTQTTRFESFTVLSDVSIGETASIEGYACDTCKKDTVCTVTTTFWDAPDYLVCTRGAYYKIAGKMTDEDIVLHMDPRVDSNQTRASLVYNVFGIVYRFGSSTSSGHYMCVKRDIDNKWYMCDDAEYHSRATQLHKHTRK